jgi:hypothetical protein
MAMVDPFLLLFLAVAGCAFCGFFGAMIGSAKGKGGLGFALGFFFGPIGLIVACLLPDDRPRKWERRGYRRPSKRESDAEEFLDGIK